MGMKRCYGWMLAMVLLLIILNLPVVTAYAATEQQSGEYVYTERNDGTVEITEYKGHTTANLKIPSTLDGKKVTAIGETVFMRRDELKTVTVPDGVQTIGSFAFAYCYNLKSVSLPNGLKDIARGAFNNCNMLTEPQIPETVTHVGSDAFTESGYDVAANYKNNTLYLNGWMIGASDKLTNVDSFQVAEGTVGLADDAFPSTNLTTLQLPASLCYIGEGAFINCSELKTVQLAANNTALAVQDNVLYNADKTCLYLYPRGKKESVYTAPSTLTTVAPYAFYCNDMIQSVSLPNSVTHIGNHAFASCSELVSAPLPTGLTSIGDCCFMYCYHLQNVTLPTGVTELPESVFQGCSELTEMILPVGLKSIGASAFYGCEKITAFTIPDTVNTIGDMAFKDCQALEQVKLPSTLKVIPAQVFDSCETLKSITLPSTLIKIEFGAFQDSGLKSVYIPDGVTEVEESAFKYSQLQSARLPEGLTAIRAHAFDGLPLEQVNIPSTVKVIELGAFSGAHFSTIKLPSGLQEIYPEAFSYCRQMTSITIPDGVTRLEESTFEECSALTSVQLPKNLKRIESFVFRQCRSLASITIPEGVTYMGSSVFDSCTALTSVQFPSTLKVMGDTVFYECESLTNVVLPDGLEQMGNLVFADTAITNVSCPSGLKKVGYNPFEQTPFVAAQTSQGIYWGDWIIGYENCEGNSVETVYIKDGTRHIADHVFAPTMAQGHNNYYMKYINLPESLESIGEGALAYNSFTTITIPKNVKVIDDYAFSNCHDLKKVTLSEGLLSLGEIVFTGCGNLTSINLPSTLQHIGSNAFIGTSIIEKQSGQEIQYVDKWVVASSGGGNLNIANGTVGICDYAFFNCTVGQITVPVSIKYMGNQCMGYKQSGDTISPYSGFKMVCYTNSAAHVYAKKYGVNYTLICNHQYETVTNKATISNDGQTYKKCATCGDVTGKTVIDKVSNITLSKTSYTHNDKVQKPAVIVKDSKGKMLKNGTDYTVIYPNGMENVDQYTVKVILDGSNYSGSKSLTYNINPKGTIVSKVTAAKSGFKVIWRKQDKQTTGYEVQYSASSNFKKRNKTVLARKNSITSKSISKLIAKKKYYVRVRTYKIIKVNGENAKLYSNWSKAKSVTTKK